MKQPKERCQCGSSPALSGFPDPQIMLLQREGKCAASQHGRLTFLQSAGHNSVNEENLLRVKFLFHTFSSLSSGFCYPSYTHEDPDKMVFELACNYTVGSFDLNVFRIPRKAPHPDSGAACHLSQEMRTTAARVGISANWGTFG